MEGPLGVDGIKNAAQVSEEAKLDKISQQKGVEESFKNGHDQKLYEKEFLKEPEKQDETKTKDLKADDAFTGKMWTKEDTKKPYIDRDPPLPDNRPFWRKMGGQIASSMGKFLKWLFLSSPERKVKGAKLPNKELDEIFKGPWYRSAWLRFSPRPPLEMTENLKLTTMAGIGRNLRKNEPLEVANWKKLMAERGAATFRQEVLSTPLFFKLAKDYSVMVDSSKERQKDIVRMGKELAREWGGEMKLKRLFVEIEKAVKEEFDGLVASKYDRKYYQHPLSPLLLLTADLAPRVDTVLAEAGIATKSKNGYWRMDILMKYAERYQDHVDYFTKTTKQEEAIKDYLQAEEKIKKHHEAFKEEILERFRNKHLKENRGDDWLLDYDRPSDEDEDKKFGLDYLKKRARGKTPSFW